MDKFQQTIEREATVFGVGLHTGIVSKMTFCPAAPNHGIKFQRIDIEGQPIVEADVENVVDTSRGTTIEKNGARIYTLEHTLAALVGLEIDNVLIKIDGAELPILDGSSLQFIEALEAAGIKLQDQKRVYFELNESVLYRDEKNNVEIMGIPLDDYRITVMVDYNSPTLGSQYASLNDIKNFKDDISNARTFCFLHEVEELYKNNLIKGGALDNAVVVVDRKIEPGEVESLSKMLNVPSIEVKELGILNSTKLRWKNEAARHKLLDVVGDFALLGVPLKAQILAARPGHKVNIAFIRKVKEQWKKANQNLIPEYNPSEPPVLDSIKIQKILPHRYPFLLIDKIFHLDEESVAGVKNLSYNEPFFPGHFPGNPIFPGVLQIEAMAQIGGILVLNTVPDPENYWTYFLGIDEFKFRKMVVPGDTLIIRCDLLQPIRRGYAKMKGVAYVGKNLVSEGVMTASIVKRDK